MSSQPVHTQTKPQAVIPCDRTATAATYLPKTGVGVGAGAGSLAYRPVGKKGGDSRLPLVAVGSGLITDDDGCARGSIDASNGLEGGSYCTKHGCLRC